MNFCRATIAVLIALAVSAAFFGGRQPRAITAHELILLDERGKTCASLCGGTHVPQPESPATPYLWMTCPFDTAGVSTLANNSVQLRNRDHDKIHLQEQWIYLSNDGNRAEVRIDEVRLGASGRDIGYRRWKSPFIDEGRIQMSNTADKRSLSVGVYRLNGKCKTVEWDTPKP
jgi:hypothetical protein